MSIIKNAIISCAGMGSRLGLNKTKCLINLFGKTLIERQLELLKDFDNIFIIVGFQAQDVISHITSLNYQNIIFVFNYEYKTTGNLYSINHVVSKISNTQIFIIDGDVIINDVDFYNFVKKVELDYDSNCIAISRSKTENAIFAEVDGSNVVNLSYSLNTEYEWCGLAYLSNSNLLIDESRDSTVFAKLKNILPMNFAVVQCMEIDTPSDLIQAEKQFNF